ncbi:acyltransferase [Kribbella qitaiheensis]|uniref:Acyltransferase n=1 Tax=Kribbella qitaiheensis TaxID=1544730 RepID=A0A7G6WXW2_9ACTN|nr:acyltransferase [Kribbella qitaiheensis]QNE18827.1 acyltransferase [Kribbella qitaiheensis]
MIAEPPERLDFLPWEYAGTASDEDRARQLERHRLLGAAGEAELAPDAFVAGSAAVFCDRLRMGERSYIGAHAYVTGEITIGADSTINPFAVVRGRITLGDGVRIGAHACLIAFNHGTAPDQPIFRQPHTALGITVGDDVWIGSNVVVLDGIIIGSHSIIGAGAVVTKNIPDWSIAVGNPARAIRDRRDSPAPTPTASTATPTTSAALAFPDRRDLADHLSAFASRAREQAGDLLARCYDGERFVDRPGLDRPGAIRPWCDAIELSDLLLRRTPDGHTRDDLVRRLRARQDPRTGLVAPGDLADTGLKQPFDGELSVLHGEASYHILCAGYALQLLDSRFEHPIHAVTSIDQLETQLNQLPWARNAWSAGAAIDAAGTAIARNLNDHNDPGPLSTLIGWLTTHADPRTGLWGQPDPDNGWLQVVNGFYRLTRGTYAQFGLPLPYPEAAIRTVLTHTQDRRHFTGNAYNACNILDVIHPLWLAGHQTDFGRADGKRWAESTLESILPRWVDGAGFAFAPDGTDDRAIPGLQGTEMWLAIIWLLSDYLGHSDALTYRPRGVHRPEPLHTLPPS